MRLITYLENDEYRPACVVDEQVIDIQRALETHQKHKNAPTLKENLHFSNVEDYFTLSDQNKELLGEIIQNIIDDSQTVANEPGLFRLLENINLAPPIIHPGKIICVAMNYPGEEKSIRKKYPVVFLKPANTLTAGNSPIILANACQHVVYEAELAFYMGRKCHNVTITEANYFIGGYTIANDIGDSVLEKRNSQWVSGKMFDTFTPVGPYLITPDEVADSQNLTIRTYHNNKLVQKANTGEMLFNVSEITSYLSTITTLLPGDLILTGSPKLMDGRTSQPDPLQPGDQLKAEIIGLGELNNNILQGE